MQKQIHTEIRFKTLFGGEYLCIKTLTEKPIKNILCDEDTRLRKSDEQKKKFHENTFSHKMLFAKTCE